MKKPSLKALLLVVLVMQAVLFADMIARWCMMAQRRARMNRRFSSGKEGSGSGSHAGAGAGAGSGAGAGKGQCTACSSIDPVSDPAYNMRELAKQSVLLEEHLTVPSKYCPDCCVKHLLHLHGLATEALMLACKNKDRYPLIVESTVFYQECMDDWQARVRGADPVKTPEPRLQLATKLREFRKEIVRVYFITAKADPPPNGTGGPGGM